MPRERTLKPISPEGDASLMDHDRTKILVARASALLVALALFTWPEWLGAADLAVPESVTGPVAVLFRYGALIWVSLAIGPWPRLASRLSWWPGNDPHNLYGLAAMLFAVCGAGGLIFAFVFIPACILLSISGKLTAWWVLGAFGSLAGGILGIWASPRLQALATAHDQERAA